MAKRTISILKPIRILPWTQIYGKEDLNLVWFPPPDGQVGGHPMELTRSNTEN